jgi:hypothetical protein
MKTSTLIAAAAMLISFGDFASAQTIHRHRPHPNWSYSKAVAMRVSGGRCRGISYGTGARSCGTATGGPVGGLSSRN